MIKAHNTIQTIKSGGSILKKLTGTILLNGKTLPVNVSYGGAYGEGSIKIGNEAFKIIMTNIDGDRIMFEGDSVLKTVSIDLNDKEFLKELRENPNKVDEFGFLNRDEFKCLPNDNAFIMIGDRRIMSFIGNCARLQ